MVIYNFGNIIRAGATKFSGISIENFALQIFPLEILIKQIHEIFSYINTNL